MAQPARCSSAVVLEAGDRVDRYVVERLLGAGGMGRVYVARDTKLERKVALKLVDPSALKDDTAFRARLMREARAAAAFNHPNAVAIYDVGEFDGAPFLAMELVDRTTLRERIGDPEVPPRRRVRWLVELARALGAAHREGIVHRDIKPENVMVSASGAVKILDFGIARRLAQPMNPSAPTATSAEPSDVVTAEGGIAGTPRYMSPEQMRGETLDGRSDMFSWGIVAHELLGGAFPWNLEAGGLAVTAAILTSPAPALDAARAGVSAATVEAIARALEKSASLRFDSMDDVADAMLEDAEGSLEAGRAGKDTTTSRARRVDTPPKTPADAGTSHEEREPPRRRAASRWLLGAVAVAAAASLVAYFASRSAAPPAQSASAPPLAASSVMSSAEPPSAERLTIFVEAFRDLDPSQKDDWLGVGLAEAIRGKLQKLPNVRVLSRDNPPPPAGSAALAVSGNYQRAGDEIRVQLSAKRSDKSDSPAIVHDVRGKMAALFDLQDALALQLATSLRGDVAPEAAAGIRQSGTRSLEAFEAYAKGLAFLTAGKVPDALRHFERAAKLDPDYQASRAELRKANARSNVIELGADGAVKKTMLMSLAPDFTGKVYTMMTNTGTPDHAWDLEGRPLNVRTKPADQHHVAIEVDLPPKPETAPGAPPEGVSFVLEITANRKVPTSRGLRLFAESQSTSEGGERTTVLRLPKGTRLLALTPLASQASADEEGTFMLTTEERPPHGYYKRLVLYTSSEDVAREFSDKSIKERADLLVDSELVKARATALSLARATDVLGVCEAARRGESSKAEERLARLEKDAEATPFWIGYARSCIARARADDAAVAKELASALSSREIPETMNQLAHRELLAALDRTDDLAKGVGVLRATLERNAFFSKGPFVKDATVEALRDRLSKDDNDPAVRFDLARHVLDGGAPLEADKLLAGHMRGPGEAYLLLLGAEVALANHDKKSALERLRALTGLLPATFLWADHAAMLSCGGDASAALDFVAARAPEVEYERPVYRALVPILRCAPDPAALAPRVVSLVREAPVLDYGIYYRLNLLAELMGDMAPLGQARAGKLVHELFDALERLAADDAHKKCDKACLEQTIERACSVRDWLGPEERAFLKTRAGLACDKPVK